MTYCENGIPRYRSPKISRSIDGMGKYGSSKEYQENETFPEVQLISNSSLKTTKSFLFRLRGVSNAYEPSDRDNTRVEISQIQNSVERLGRSLVSPFPIYLNDKDNKIIVLRFVKIPLSRAQG